MKFKLKQSSKILIVAALTSNFILDGCSGGGSVNAGSNAAPQNGYLSASYDGNQEIRSIQVTNGSIQKVFISLKGLRAPSLHRLGDELRTVVAPDVPWRIADRRQLVQHRHHIPALAAPPHLDRQALPRELVDDREPLERTAGRRPVEREVPAPDVVGGLGRTRQDARFARAQGSSLSLLLRHFETLLPPQTQDPRGAGTMPLLP